MQLGLLPLITLVLIILKLTDNLDWSWGWVFLPFFVGLVLAVLVTIIIECLRKTL